MTTTRPDETDETDELDDLLDNLPVHPGKGAARPLVRTPKQRAAAQAAARAAEKQAQKDAENALTAARAAQLAQIANLIIAGHTFDSIGAAIGATGAEVEAMMNAESARFVRNQPALRTFVRNYISERYSLLLESVWDAASDSKHKDQYDAQVAAVRILERLGRLHGADAPVQKEVKIESAPESVNALVNALAAQAGMGYDSSIFDTVPGTVIHAAHEDAVRELAVSGNMVEEDDDDDTL